jgi:acylphosphatase
LILERLHGIFGLKMERARARVFIEGHVQGVFFRHHTREMAHRLGLTGWVKNRSDGNVEALFDGERDRIDKIIRWCHRGPSEASVTRVTVEWEVPSGDFQDFTITY